MYLIEIIIKKILLKIKNKNKNTAKFGFSEDRTEEETKQDCASHVYLPIDSSKEYLACRDCGHIIKNNKK